MPNMFCGFSVDQLHMIITLTPGPRVTAQPSSGASPVTVVEEVRMGQRQLLESPPRRGTAHGSQVIGQRGSHDQAYCQEGGDLCPSVSHIE